MCNRRQLGLITVLLYTFTGSALLARAEWKGGEGHHKRNSTLLLNFKELNKAGSVAVALGFHVPNCALRLWDHFHQRLFGVRHQELLLKFNLLSFQFVCGGPGSNSKLSKCLALVFAYFRRHVSRLYCRIQVKYNQVICRLQKIEICYLSVTLLQLS